MRKNTVFLIGSLSTVSTLRVIMMVKSIGNQAAMRREAQINTNKLCLW